MEATKWLKPSISVSRIGDSASVQGNYGDSALNASSSFIEIVRRSVSDGLHHENGGFPTSVAYSEVARPKRFELLTPQIRSLVKGPEEMAHRPNREMGIRTSFAPETTPSKRNERDRTQTKPQ